MIFGSVMSLDALLGTCYRYKILVPRQEDYALALKALRKALKTDAATLAEAKSKRSAMTADVLRRDHISRVYAPIIDEALSGLNDDDRDEPGS